MNFYYIDEKIKVLALCNYSGIRINNNNVNILQFIEAENSAPNNLCFSYLQVEQLFFVHLLVVVFCFFASNWRRMSRRGENATGRVGSGRDSYVLFFRHK